MHEHNSSDKFSSRLYFAHKYTTVFSSFFSSFKNTHKTFHSVMHCTTSYCISVVLRCKRQGTHQKTVLPSSIFVKENMIPPPPNSHPWKKGNTENVCHIWSTHLAGHYLSFEAVKHLNHCHAPSSPQSSVAGSVTPWCDTSCTRVSSTGCRYCSLSPTHCHYRSAQPKHAHFAHMSLFIWELYIPLNFVILHHSRKHQCNNTKQKT